MMPSGILAVSSIVLSRRMPRILVRSIISIAVLKFSGFLFMLILVPFTVLQLHNSLIMLLLPCLCLAILYAQLPFIVLLFKAAFYKDAATYQQWEKELHYCCLERRMVQKGTPGETYRQKVTAQSSYFLCLFCRHQKRIHLFPVARHTDHFTAQNPSAFTLSAISRMLPDSNEVILT